MAENFDVFNFELSAEDMGPIATLDTKASLFCDHRDPKMVKMLSEAKLNTYDEDAFEWGGINLRPPRSL